MWFNMSDPGVTLSLGYRMRISRLFGKTQREIPAEADTASHRLLLRAGMIGQVAAGVYSYLPLAWRVIGKIEGIVRDEMDRAGGQELLMPALQPLDMWQTSGRDRALGNTLFTLSDRRERQLALGPTHEEVVTQLVSHHVQSYRDLPLLLYQIQTKFRDEPRPRNGLVRAREFIMKDLYSFDADEVGLETSYQKMLAAYRNVYDRCGLTEAVAVEADSGAIGGKDSHEFIVLTDSGEDEIISCSGCDYAANAEKADFAKSTTDAAGGGEAGAGGEPAALEEVATPGMKTIEQVADFLGVPQSATLKAVFYVADGQFIFVAIRGDLEVNEIKLGNALPAVDLRMATDAEVSEAGIVAGSASPAGISGIRVVVDDSVPAATNLVGGANKPDSHLKNVNHGRDFTAEIVADIALARAGDACPRCGQPLESAHGIEVGHVFKVGTHQSDSFGAYYVNPDGDSRPIVMGCYGIGISRLMAAAVEQNHDDKGIIWPLAIAPFQVYLTPLYRDDTKVEEVAEGLYEQFERAGYEVIIDDRKESPGVKFNDADLLGAPLRVTVSPRSLDKGSAEFKRRDSAESELVPLGEITARLAEEIDGNRAS